MVELKSDSAASGSGSVAKTPKGFEWAAERGGTEVTVCNEWPIRDPKNDIRTHLFVESFLLRLFKQGVVNNRSTWPLVWLSKPIEQKC